MSTSNSLARCALLAGLLAGCDERAPATVVPGAPAAASGGPGTLGAPRAEPPRPGPGSGPAVLLSPQAPRLEDAAFRAAVAAFERGETEPAQAAALALPDGLDIELLRARLAAARGDDIAAVRAIESLRGRFPGEGRVFATAAEIHAAAGRLSSAEDEIREGLALAGPTADLTRARGVLALCREGGAAKGLEHLLAALDLVPALEFTARPLSQAHLLLGNAALAAESPIEAAGHAKAALLALPEEREAERLLADALAAAGDFDAALAAYERLLARGVELRVALLTLYTRAATADLLAGRKEQALERWLRARELGASAADLGFGASALAKAANDAIDLAVEAAAKKDLSAARTALERALRLQPSSIEALYMLGVVRYQSQDLEGAAESWRRAFELALESGEAAPEPVHLHLAKLHLQRAERERARDVLVSYLTQWPEGEFAAATRELLAQVDG